MRKDLRHQGSNGKQRIRFENGKIYFTREMERKFFFILTMIMLLAGGVSASGLF